MKKILKDKSWKPSSKAQSTKVEELQTLTIGDLKTLTLIGEELGNVVGGMVQEFRDDDWDGSTGLL